MARGAFSRTNPREIKKGPGENMPNLQLSDTTKIEEFIRDMGHIDHRLPSGQAARLMKICDDLREFVKDNRGDYHV